MLLKVPTKFVVLCRFAPRPLVGMVLAGTGLAAAKETLMSSYVLSFRSAKDRSASEAEEAAWGEWFQRIAPSINDFGHRVGNGRTLGVANGRSDVLSGYIVVSAANLDDAETLAAGCPGIAHGGGVDVAEVVES
jgi:hypothetical protein